MRIKSILAALLLMVAGLQTARSQKVILYMPDKQIIEYGIQEIDSIVFVDADLICPDNHHPHAIDLGLPSGTKWACCNVGARTPEGYGDYFAWGETKPKDVYNRNTYFDSDYQKYHNGGHTNLLPADDAATANWGSDWQMPSRDQIEELITGSYVTTTRTALNGVNGYKITSKSTGNSIFLPATGHRYDTILDHAGSNGEYWSRTLDREASYNANILFFDPGLICWIDDNRSYGASVRAVYNNTVETTYYWYVGQTDPSTMSSIEPIVTDTTSPGWRKIGTSLPTYSSSRMLWNGAENNISFGNRDYYYLALPASSLKLYNSGGDNEMDGCTDLGTIVINNVTYYIYKRNVPHIPVEPLPTGCSDFTGTLLLKAMTFE